MMLKLKTTLAAALAATVVLGSIGVDSADARSRHRRGDAAAIGLIGTIAAIAAADSYRDRHYSDGYSGPYYRGYSGYSGHDRRGYAGQRYHDNSYTSTNDAPPNHNPGFDR